MDVYTTSFTYPRRSRQFDFQQQAQVDAANAAAAATLASPSFIDPYSSAVLQHQLPTQSISDVSADADAVQKLAVMAMSLHGCHVSYYPVGQGRGWNFHITGAYQQVMAARGLILKECPIQVKFAVLQILTRYLLRFIASFVHQGDAVRDPRLTFFEAYA